MIRRTLREIAYFGFGSAPTVRAIDVIVGGKGGEGSSWPLLRYSASARWLRRKEKDECLLLLLHSLDIFQDPQIVWEGYSMNFITTARPD